MHFSVDHFTVIPFPYDPAANPTLNTNRPLHNYQHPFYSADYPPPTGKQYGDPLYVGYQDTLSIPPLTQAWIHIPMTEGTHGDDPIAGHLVMHCHILNHEDAGMMANVIATKTDGVVSKSGDAQIKSSFAHSLPPRELPEVLADRPLHLQDADGQTSGAAVFTKSDYSMVTFGFTHCDGTCPATLEKCTSALSKLTSEDRAKIAPYFISLDPHRDHGKVLTAYARRNALPKEWNVLADSDLSGTRAFGVRIQIRHSANGDTQLWHSAVVYIIDRRMNIRAAFDPEDSTDFMVKQLQMLTCANTAKPLKKKDVSIRIPSITESASVMMAGPAIE